MPRRAAVPTEAVTAQLAALAVWLLGEGTEDAPRHPPAQGSGDRQRVIAGARQLLGQQRGGLGKVAVEVMLILSRDFFLVFV